LLITTPKSQENAQAACNARCGHLAAYVSQAEQGEVESWYTTQVGPRAHLGCSWRAQPVPADTRASRCLPHSLLHSLLLPSARRLPAAAGLPVPRLPRQLLDRPGQQQLGMAQVQLAGHHAKAAGSAGCLQALG
jgi:hypothetical protein